MNSRYIYYNKRTKLKYYILHTLKFTVLSSLYVLIYFYHVEVDKLKMF